MLDTARVARAAAWVVLIGAGWVLGVLTARHGGRGLNVAFCVVNGCFGLAVLVRCMFDFRLRSLCADLPVDDVHDEHRRRRGSQDTWSHSGGQTDGGPEIQEHVLLWFVDSARRRPVRS